jgi:DNA-binding transcriptional LysR family regulator
MAVNKMELRDIEYFAVVAEHGHLGRAAEALGLTTPALSKSLRRLEKSVEAKLVKRTPKGVELTTEGSALLAHVAHLRTSLHDVAREVADLSRGRVGHLRIGAHTDLVEPLLTPACSVLLKDGPKVTLTVSVGNNPLLVPALRTGDLDLIVSAIPAVPFADIIQEHLIDDEFAVYASATHRLARQRRVTIADVATERWALTESGTLTSQSLHRAFENHGLAAPKVAMVAVSVSLKLRTVASTDLLGFSSRRALRQVGPELRLVELTVKELSWRRRVGIGYRKDGYLSPAAQRFIEILKTTAKEIAKGP